MRTRTICARALIQTAMLALLAAGSVTAANPQAGDWPVYGYDAGGTRFSPLQQIDTGNVSRLRPAWTYHTGELPAPSNLRGQQSTAFETTPLLVDGVLYLSTAANRIIALDPLTGRERWKYDPQAHHPGPVRSRAHRGVAYWPGDAHTPPRILFGTLDGRLIALNAHTGVPVPGFGNEGEVNLRDGVADKFPALAYGVTSPPAIVNDLVITGS